MTQDCYPHFFSIFFEYLLLDLVQTTLHALLEFLLYNKFSKGVKFQSMKKNKDQVEDALINGKEPVEAQSEMVVKKKLDIFNLFYSGAAVVILIGALRLYLLSKDVLLLPSLFHPFSP